MLRKENLGFLFFFCLKWSKVCFKSENFNHFTVNLEAFWEKKNLGFPFLTFQKGVFWSFHS